MSDPPGPPKLQVDIDPGAQEVVVTLFEDDVTRSATRTLNLADLDGFIRTLGNARRMLVADNPYSPIAEGESTEIVANAAWYTRPFPELGMSGFFFRHPAYGLLGFAIPYVQAAQIMSLLAQQIAPALSPATGGAPEPAQRPSGD